MANVKTHTFRFGKYRIVLAERILGCCDLPGDDGKYDMNILKGNSLDALQSALHEAMHADGIPDKYMHDKDGCTDTERIGMFLWRLGWRRHEAN